MSSNKYDVIIIGAGIGGLTAGAILARNGKKVLVLEKNPVAGGYAVNFKRKGFEFDASLHLTQGCNRGGITYNILRACGVDKKIKFIKPRLLYHSIYPDLEIKVEQNNPDVYIGLLKEKFPREKAGVTQLLKDAKKLLLSFEAFQKYGIVSSDLSFYANRTCSDIINKYINDEKLISVISQLWGYFGLPPQELSSYYLPFYLYDYLYNGGFYPIGGSSHISEALKDVILSNKGEISLNTKVNKLHIKNNLVEYVITDKGKELYGRNVVSNIDSRKTFLDLVGEGYLPDFFVSNIKNMYPSISAFQVYLGLDKDKINIPNYEIFINPSYDLNSQYSMCINNEIEKCPFVVTIYSNLQEHKRDNKATIALTAISGYDFWKNIPKDNYNNIKANFAKILLKRAEDKIPNLSSYVKVMEIATPLTMERYTGNYKGAIYGWAHDIFQCGIRRFFTTTPIRNLHLASAWTYPGGGISGVMHAGELAAKYILEGKFHTEMKDDGIFKNSSAVIRKAL